MAETKRVLTLGLLQGLINNFGVDDFEFNTDGKDLKYCPTVGDMASNRFINSSPKSNGNNPSEYKDGWVWNKLNGKALAFDSYTDNQLICYDDIRLVYTRHSKISIKASTTSVTACNGQTSIVSGETVYVGKTIWISNITTSGTIEYSSTTVNTNTLKNFGSFSIDKNFVSMASRADSSVTITFTENTVADSGTSSVTSSDARNVVVTYNDGYEHTTRVTIQQAKNNVSDYKLSSVTHQSLTLTSTTATVDACSNLVTLPSSGELKYTAHVYKSDDCSNVVWHQDSSETKNNVSVSWSTSLSWVSVNGNTATISAMTADASSNRSGNIVASYTYTPMYSTASKTITSNFTITQDWKKNKTWSVTNQQVAATTASGSKPSISAGTLSWEINARCQATVPSSSVITSVSYNPTNITDCIKADRIVTCTVSYKLGSTVVTSATGSTSQKAVASSYEITTFSYPTSICFNANLWNQMTFVGKEYKCDDEISSYTKNNIDASYVTYHNASNDASVAVTSINVSSTTNSPQYYAKITWHNKTVSSNTFTIPKITFDVSSYGIEVTSFTVTGTNNPSIGRKGTINYTSDCSTTSSETQNNPNGCTYTYSTSENGTYDSSIPAYTACTTSTRDLWVKATWNGVTSNPYKGTQNATVPTKTYGGSLIGDSLTITSVNPSFTSVSATCVGHYNEDHGCGTSSVTSTNVTLTSLIYSTSSTFTSSSSTVPQYSGCTPSSRTLWIQASWGGKTAKTSVTQMTTNDSDKNITSSSITWVETPSNFACGTVPSYKATATFDIISCKGNSRTSSFTVYATYTDSSNNPFTSWNGFYLDRSVKVSASKTFSGVTISTSTTVTQTACENIVTSTSYTFTNVSVSTSSTCSAPTVGGTYDTIYHHANGTSRTVRGSASSRTKFYSDAAMTTQFTAWTTTLEDKTLYWKITHPKDNSVTETGTTQFKKCSTTCVYEGIRIIDFEVVGGNCGQTWSIPEGRVIKYGYQSITNDPCAIAVTGASRTYSLFIDNVLSTANTISTIKSEVEQCFPTPTSRTIEIKTTATYDGYTASASTKFEQESCSAQFEIDVNMPTSMIRTNIASYSASGNVKQCGTIVSSVSLVERLATSMSGNNYIIQWSRIPTFEEIGTGPMAWLSSKPPCPSSSELEQCQSTLYYRASWLSGSTIIAQKTGSTIQYHKTYTIRVAEQNADIIIGREYSCNSITNYLNINCVVYRCGNPNAFTNQSPTEILGFYTNSSLTSNSSSTWVPSIGSLGNPDKRYVLVRFGCEGNMAEQWVELTSTTDITPVEKVYTILSLNIPSSITCSSINTVVGIGRINDSEVQTDVDLREGQNLIVRYSTSAVTISSPTTPPIYTSSTISTNRTLNYTAYWIDEDGIADTKSGTITQYACGGSTSSITQSGCTISISGNLGSGSTKMDGVTVTYSGSTFTCSPTSTSYTVSLNGKNTVIRLTFNATSTTGAFYAFLVNCSVAYNGTTFTSVSHTLDYGGGSWTFRNGSNTIILGFSNWRALTLT